MKTVSQQADDLIEDLGSDTAAFHHVSAILDAMDSVQSTDCDQAFYATKRYWLNVQYDIMDNVS